MAIKETNTIFEAIKQYHEELVKPKIKEITDIDTQIRTDLNTEITNRDTQDYNTNLRIDEEAIVRAASDAEIISSLNKAISELLEKFENDLDAVLTEEANIRLKADTDLLTRITSEISQQNIEWDALKALLEDEIKNRNDADNTTLNTLRSELLTLKSVLQDYSDKKSSTVQENLNIHIEAYNDRVEDLESADTELNNKILKEVDDRAAAVSDAEKKLTAEENRAKEEERTIKTQLSTEVTARETAIAKLTTSIATEANDREAGDSNLANNLNAEIMNRTSADAILNKRITDEVSNINSNIETAISQAKADIVGITDAISKDVVTNTDNISNLFTNIDNINSELSSIKTEGIPATAEIKTDLNELSTSVANSVTDLHADINRLDVKLIDEGIARAQAISTLKTSTEKTTSELQSQLDSLSIKNSSNATNIGVNTNRLEEINLIIPAEAALTNKLADKAYVESLIATESSIFIGTFESLEELKAITGAKNNSYAFHKTETGYTRYKYIALEGVWKEEYTLNNTSFTESQWEAINSNVTADIVNKVKINENNIATEIITRTDAVAALEGRIVILENSSANNVELTNHKNQQDNPHKVTATQVGLGKVKNYDIDTEPKLSSSNYISSGAVYTIKTDLGTHIANTNNPHNITATQIGLGLVKNKEMDDIPSDTDNYVKSSGVKSAIDEVQSKINNHITTVSGNPHFVSKADVLLGDVENKPMDISPIENSTNYVTSGGVWGAVNEVDNNLTAHKNAINPHGITRELLQVDKLVNAIMDTKPTEGSTNYISSGAVEAALTEVKTTLVTSVENIK